MYHVEGSRALVVQPHILAERLRDLRNDFSFGGTAAHHELLSRMRKEPDEVSISLEIS